MCLGCTAIGKTYLFHINHLVGQSCSLRLHIVLFMSVIINLFCYFDCFPLRCFPLELCYACSDSWTLLACLHALYICVNIHTVISGTIKFKLKIMIFFSQAFFSNYKARLEYHCCQSTLVRDIYLSCLFDKNINCKITSFNKYIKTSSFYSLYDNFH